MKFITKILLFFVLILIGKHAIGQDSRIILNNNAFMVMDNSVFLVVNNQNTNAITETNGGGMIISEDEWNEVVWITRNNTGLYTIPFGTQPVSQGGNGVKIPLEINLTTAGAEIANGSLFFSTWETMNDDNTPLPSSTVTVDNGLMAVDRFWGIYPEGYTTNPEVDITFTYDDNANEIGGTNNLTEANLVAQYYDNSIDAWGSTFGSVNTTNNTVSPVILNSSLFNLDNWLWTLVDGNFPLPLNSIKMDLTCNVEGVLISWDIKSSIKIENIEIQSSHDGDEWSSLYTINKASNNDSWQSNQSNAKFFRIKVLDDQGNYNVSNVSINNCELPNYDIRLFPNPTRDISFLKLNDQYESVSLKIYDSRSALMLEKNYFDVNEISLDDINNFSKGVYHISVVLNNRISRNLKLVILD